MIIIEIYIRTNKNSKSSSKIFESRLKFLNNMKSSRSSSRINTSNISLNQNNSHSSSLEESEFIPGNNWIQKIQFAFNEADVGNKKYITLDQWMNSRLGLIVTSEKLVDDRLREYFIQIDSNSDGVVSWEELVEYLTCQQRNINADSFDKNLNLVHVAPDLATAHKFRKTTDCLRAIYVRYIEQIITLTESALTFWNLDCNPSFHFTDTDGFVDFCYLSCLSRLAIATKNRKIIFFDIKTKCKMPFSIKATVDDEDIPKLSLSDTKETLHNFKKHPKPPLYHISTAISSNPEQPLIYVGNQEGRVEIFSLFPSQKVRYSWDAERIKVKILHKGPITQITYVSSISSFISCGEDGAIYIWQFDQKTKLFNISYSYKETMNTPISSFVFDDRTGTIIYTMPAHYFGVWKVYTHQHLIKETPSQLISLIALVSISEESSFIVTVSTNNFISIYVPPNLDIVSSYFMNYHHFLCAPSKAIYINNHLYLIGNYISCWHCQTADSDGLPPHKHPLIDALANDTFGRIITCDETGDIFSWDITTGNKLLSFNLSEKESVVTSIKSDSLSRRLIIGYSNGVVKVVSAISGSLLSDTGKEPLEGGCNYALFATMLSNKYIIAANGRSSIVLYEDHPSKNFRFLRCYHGHNEQISKIYNLKNTFLLSIGMENELFLWSNKLTIPIFKYELPNEPTEAADLSFSDSLFIVGDILGYVHVMTKDNKAPISSINIFKMNISSPISSLASSESLSIIVVGNREGYIRYCTYEDDKLVEKDLFCAHFDTIQSLAISEKSKIVISSGRDDEIRLWNVDELKFIGVLGKHKKWKLSDESTFQPLPFETEKELFIEKKSNGQKNGQNKNDFNNFNNNFDISDSTDNLVDNGNNQKEEDDITLYRPVTQPEFTLPSSEKMFKEIEETCLAGRDRPKMYERLMRVKPSQTTIKGQELMQFGDLVTDVELENTAKMVKQLRHLGVRKKKKKVTD